MVLPASSWSVFERRRRTVRPSELCGACALLRPGLWQSHCRTAGSTRFADASRDLLFGLAGQGIALASLVRDNIAEGIVPLPCG